MGDVNIVLIEKLVDENQQLLSDLKNLQENAKAETIRLKRLVNDSALMKQENAILSKRVVTCEKVEKQAREQLILLRQERQFIERDRESLHKLIASLRESKSTLEFEAKHLGAQDPDFVKAVIQTIQQTSELRVITEAIDNRLVSLRLLDPSSAMTVPLQLMGERLVPVKEVLQLKKERQLWQTRYMETMAELKCKYEDLNEKMIKKEEFLKQTQAKASMTSLKTALKDEVAQLKEEVKILKKKYAEALSLLEKTSLAVPQPAPVPLKLPSSTISKSASRTFLGIAPSTPTMKHQRTLRSPKFSVSEPNDESRDDQVISSRGLSQTSLTSPLSRRRLSIPTVKPPSRKDDAIDQQLSFRSTTKQTIGSTVGQSQFGTILAREVAALEKSQATATEPTVNVSEQTTTLQELPSRQVLDIPSMRIASSFLNGGIPTPSSRSRNKTQQQPTSLPLTTSITPISRVATSAFLSGASTPVSSKSPMKTVRPNQQKDDEMPRLASMKQFVPTADHGSIPGEQFGITEKTSQFKEEVAKLLEGNGPTKCRITSSDLESFLKSLDEYMNDDLR